MFDGDIDAPFSHLLLIADSVLAKLLTEIPDALKDATGRLTFVMEDIPNHDFLLSGVLEDQLGLFEGPDAADDSSTGIPRIVLWLGNIWEMCRASEADYREEVKTTLLHEIGHYLGLNEEQIIERGLE